MPQLLGDAVWWGGGSWKRRTVAGGPGGLRALSLGRGARDPRLHPRPLDWSLELECVCWGTFLNSATPSPEVRELGPGPDSSQALARPQAPEPPTHFAGGGRRGLCTIVIDQGVLERTRGSFFPQPQTHFSKWSRLPLLLSWASRAGARLARPGFPDSWPSEPSFTSIWL